MKNFNTTIFISIICFIFYFSIFAGINSGSNLKNSENKISKSPVPTQTVPKNFINCIFNEAYDAWEHKAWILNFLDRYSDSLHFNSIHYYNYFEASSEYGTFNTLMSPSQIQNNTKLLDSVGRNNLKTFTARQNIEKYCYGQRLVYEVSEFGSTSENDGFCYQNVLDSSFTMDQGRTVLHAVPGQNDSGWLCKNIYENLQHTDLWDFVQLDTFAWHLKPMMRIDTNNFNNNDTTKVVAIVTKSYGGSRIDSVIVRVNNFGNGGIYKGQYVDKFSFPLGINLLKTSGSPSNGLGKDRDKDSRQWKNNCKVDFKIYWYGLVEVWFDKLTVDDDRANRMFNPGAETPIENFIIQEANTLGSHPVNIAFFADEVVYSNIPCIKYVDSVLKSANPDSKLHTATTNYLNVRGMKNDALGHSAYFQNVKLNSVSNDAHEFSGGGIMIPSNFQSYDSRIDPDWIASNNTEYNENLQKRAFGDKDAISPENMEIGLYDPPSWGSFIYQIELVRHQRDSYSPGTQFIMQPQIQAVLNKRDFQPYFTEGLREPTNEEIEAQTMISISHGAEGICWFMYPSLKDKKGVFGIEDLPYKNYYTDEPNNTVQDTFFTYYYGLTELLQNNPLLPPRYSNMYGQDKWNYVKKMNIKIEHWKPTLDKIEWKSGWSVHKETASHEFISDIKSFKRDPAIPYTLTYEDAIKYWEMGFFNPDDASDKAKYFIMVNRRCVPDLNSQGDFRGLSIKFDSTKLAGFTNWKVIKY